MGFHRQWFVLEFPKGFYYLAFQSQKQLKIGVLMAKDNPNFDTTIGFSRSAGGLTVALRRIEAEQLLPDFNITFAFAFDQCNEAYAAGGAISLIKEQDADVIIGPACSSCKPGRGSTPLK